MSQQPTDIVLAGAGYMLEPGTYERTQDGIADGRTGRVVQTDFFAGQRRAIQLERDAAFGGLTVGPALGGQGVTPWPKITASAILEADNTPTGARIPWAIIGDRCYFAIGDEIYYSSAANDRVSVYDAGTPITDITAYAGDVLIAYGSAKDMEILDTATHTPTTLLAGKKATRVVGYAGFAIWAPPRDDGLIEMVTGSGIEERWLDGEILELTLAGSYVYAVTRLGIYRFSGRVVAQLIPNPAYSGPGDDPTIPGLRWNGEFTPYYQHGSWSSAADFRVVAGYGGRFYVWANGELLEHDPDGDRAGWRTTGLQAAECYGGASIAGYLWVTIGTATGARELWAWDGAGWWRVLSSALTLYCWPIPTMRAGFDVQVHQVGSATTQRITTREPIGQGPALPDGGSWESSMLHAGAPDRPKAWRRVGAVFATPELNGVVGSSADSVILGLDYSLDGGDSWTNAGVLPASLLDPPLTHGVAEMQLSIDADIATAPAVSRHIMLRVTWGAIEDWAPILTAVWAEYELLESPTRRRRWTFAVAARDQTIDRDGACLTRTGQQLIEELWDAWETGSTVTYRDIDYDETTTEHQVRIIGISEKVRNPDDRRHEGDARVMLTLVEL